MPDTNGDSLTLLNQLAGKIALELVFAQPGQDTGLLPVKSASAAEELDAQADALQEAVAGLLHLVGGQVSSMHHSSRTQRSQVTPEEKQPASGKIPACASVASFAPKTPDPGRASKREKAPALVSAGRNSSDLPGERDFNDF